MTVLKSYYFRPLVYYVGFGAAAIFILSYFIPALFPLGVAGLICLSIAILVDSLLLYGKKQGLLTNRHLQERFSNGDENKVQILLENNYGFAMMIFSCPEAVSFYQNKGVKLRHPNIVRYM